MAFFDRIPIGGNDEYVIFSTAYFITIISVIIILFLSFRYMSYFKGKKYEKYIRIIWAIYMLYTTYNIDTFYYQNNLPWYAYIPEGTCGFAILIGAYTLITKNKFTFKLLFFWGWGAFIALFAPTILEGPRYYFFYQFQLRHLSIVLVCVYMMKVFDYKILRNDYKIYVYVTLPMAIFGLIINYIINDPENLNILYMMKPAITNTPLDWFYNVHPLFYSFVWVLIAFLFGYLYGLPFYNKKYMNINKNITAVG